MADWGLRAQGILREAGFRVYLLTSYVDDVRLLMDQIPAGYYFNRYAMKILYDEKLVEVHKQEDSQCAHSRMNRLLLETFGAINQDLEFTLELPEEFPDCWLPTLDTSLKLVNGRLTFKFFEKHMVSRYCIMRSSGVSWNSKMATLSNEVIRRCSKTDPKLPRETLDVILGDFWCKLSRSGYSNPEADKIIADGVKGYQKLLDRRGGQLHRDMSEGKMERVVKKLSGKVN